MGGGLLQLVAYGAQDAYLSGNPHITFWKILYKRHTNFAMEAFRVNFTGAPAWGQRVVAVVNRNADLIWKTYLEITLPVTDGVTNLTAWTGGAQRRLGYLMVQQVEVEIGGQIIDRQYGEWLYLWETLTADFDTAMKLDNLVGGAYENADTTSTLNDAVNLVQGAAATGASLAGAANALPAPKDMALYIDYVYLDVEERRRFAQESHEYLIEQLQYEGQQQITSASERIDLTLNHPIKELIWVFQDARKTDCSIPATSGSANYTPAAYTQPFSYDDIVNRSRIQINGQDRFEERYGDYFWKVQPYQHHTGGGYTRASVSASAVISKPSPNPINVYSFAIAPEEHQPSGTCNFSRIDNATLVIDSIRTSTDIGNYPTKSDPYNFRLYAVNYNILRIMSGMGGLAYSN